MNYFFRRLEPKFVEAINKHRCILYKTRQQWTRAPWDTQQAQVPAPASVLSKPSAITKIAITNVKTHCTYEGRQVGFIYAKRAHINVVKYLPSVTQTSGEVFGFDLIDTSVDTSLHRSIIRAVHEDVQVTSSTDDKPAAAVKATLDQSSKNTNDFSYSKIDFHYTSKEHMNSLLEVRLHGVRFLYLQRFTMMIVGYIRDFVLPSFRCGPPKGTTMEKPNPPGMMRYTISFVDSEVHLPVNSRSPEGSMYIYFYIFHISSRSIHIHALHVIISLVCLYVQVLS